jgi:hypothetical protein
VAEHARVLALELALDVGLGVDHRQPFGFHGTSCT